MGGCKCECVGVCVCTCMCVCAYLNGGRTHRDHRRAVAARPPAPAHVRSPPILQSHTSVWGPYAGLSGLRSRPLPYTTTPLSSLLFLNTRIGSMPCCPCLAVSSGRSVPSGPRSVVPTTCTRTPSPPSLSRSVLLALLTSLRARRVVGRVVEGGPPQKALRGGIPGSFLEPLGGSWSHFVGIYRQNLTRSLEN